MILNSLVVKCNPSISSFFFFWSFLGPLGRHMEVPRLGVENWSCSRWPTPQPQQRRIRAASATYTTAHSNAGSFTHRVRPGIEPVSPWMLAGFINHGAWMGTPPKHLLTELITTPKLGSQAFHRTEMLPDECSCSPAGLHAWPPDQQWLQQPRPGNSEMQILKPHPRSRE